MSEEGARPLITSRDEQMHEPGGKRHWQESFYFNWAEPDGRSFGLVRVGYDFALRKIDGLLLTIRDGAPEFIYPAIGIPLVFDPPPVEYGVRAGSLALTMREPLARWHIGLLGRDEVDLRWNRVNDPFAFVDAEAGGPQHFEQLGTVRGTIRVRGTEREIAGLGHRDKSWGPRDWNGITGWDWLAANFGEDLGFTGTILPLAGERVSGGFVHRDGVNRRLQSAAVDYEWGRLAHIPRTALITLLDDQGDTYEVRAEAVAQFPLYKHGLFIQETHARFELTLAGQTRTGVGVLEHAWHAGRRGLLGRSHQFAPVLAVGARQALPKR